MLTQIANTVIELLKDKNATLDVMKAFINVALKTASAVTGRQFTEKDYFEVFDDVILGLRGTFNPLRPVYVIETQDKN